MVLLLLVVVVVVVVVVKKLLSQCQYLKPVKQKCNPCRTNVSLLASEKPHFGSLQTRIQAAKRN